MTCPHRLDRDIEVCVLCDMRDEIADLKDERDEARHAARELLKRLVLVLSPTASEGWTWSPRPDWEAKYPWLKLEKWPPDGHHSKDS